MMFHEDNRRCEQIKENVKDAKRMSDKICNENMKRLDENFNSTTKMCKELEELKLKNEELERLIDELDIKKSKLEINAVKERQNYEALHQRLCDTKNLLKQSHDQNVQLSSIIEKMRESEKHLLSENKKLRKAGSLHDHSSNVQHNIDSNAIVNLEKELKFWKDKASQYVSLVPEYGKENSGSLSKKMSKRKVSNHIKRHNKSTVRSRSAEANYRKSKEEEFNKLKKEKAQMKDLLSNLESQISDIQSNVLKISEERQRYRELFNEAKHKLDHYQNLSKEFDHQNAELGSHNHFLNSELNRLYQEKEIIGQENKSLESNCQILSEELQRTEADRKSSVYNLNKKLEEYKEENLELKSRIDDILEKLHKLETEMANVEDEVEDKENSLKKKTIEIDQLKETVNVLRLENDNKSTKINDILQNLKEKNEMIDDYMEQGKNTEHQLEMKMTEEKRNRETIDNLRCEFQKQQISFSAQIVKFENHLRNAEEIIAAKIKLITSLEGKLANYESENVRREEKIVALQKQLSSLQNELDNSQHKYEELRISKEIIEKHLNSITANNEHQIKNLMENNKIINDKTIEIDALKAENYEFRRLLDEKEKNLKSYYQSHKNLEVKLKDLESENRKCNSMLNQYSADKTEKDCYVTSLLEVIEIKDKKINELQSNIENETYKVKELNGQIDDYEDCIVQSTSRGSALEIELNSLRHSNARLKRQKEEMNCALSDRNVLIGQLRAQLNQNPDNNCDSSNKNSKLQNFSSVNGFRSISNIELRERNNRNISVSPNNQKHELLECL